MASIIFVDKAHFVPLAAEYANGDGDVHVATSTEGRGLNKSTWMALLRERGTFNLVKCVGLKVLLLHLKKMHIRDSRLAHFLLLLVCDVIQPDMLPPTFPREAFQWVGPNEAARLGSDHRPPKEHLCGGGEIVVRDVRCVSVYDASPFVEGGGMHHLDAAWIKALPYEMVQVLTRARDCSNNNPNKAEWLLTQNQDTIFGAVAFDLLIATLKTFPASEEAVFLLDTVTDLVDDEVPFEWIKSARKQKKREGSNKRVRFE